MYSKSVILNNNEIINMYKDYIKATNELISYYKLTNDKRGVELHTLELKLFLNNFIDI